LDSFQDFSKKKKPLKHPLLSAPLIAESLSYPKSIGSTVGMTGGTYVPQYFGRVSNIQVVQKQVGCIAAKRIP
jgi:hypothetical protein